MSIDLAAVNPQTGEVLDHLEQQPPETLAEALDAIHTHQAALKRWSDALTTELRRRLKLRQTTTAVFGAWEVNAARRRTSGWDADELETALGQLVEHGTVRAADVADVITRDPVVSKSKARDLLARLDGQAAEMVKACRTWREQPGPLTVTRSVEMSPAAAEGALPDSHARVPVPPAPAGPPQPPPTLNHEELFR